MPGTKEQATKLKALYQKLRSEYERLSAAVSTLEKKQQSLHKAVSVALDAAKVKKVRKTIGA